MDAFAGAVGVSDSDGKGTPVYSVCMAQGDFNNYYYAHIVREMAKTGFIQSLYRGIRERSSDFRFDVFGSQLLPIPPRSEQDQIVRFLDWKVSLINKYLSAKQKQIELINNLITLVVTNNISSHSKSRKRVRLKHLVKTPLQYGANESGSDYSDKFPRYIRITDITLDGLLKNVNKLSLSVPDYSKFLLNDGDILLARSGATIGKSFIYKEKYGPCCFAGYLIRVIPNKEKIIPEFLNYFTQTQIYKEWLNTIFIQSTIQNVSAEKYNNLQIPLPPLNEQLNIVNAISKQLENLQKLLMPIANKINLMQEYRARLISDVVSGRVDVRSVAAPDKHDSLHSQINRADSDTLPQEYIEGIYTSNKVAVTEDDIPF
jgi:type I restriction enzyme S subunit